MSHTQPIRVQVMADVRLYREGLHQALLKHVELAVVDATPVDEAGLETTRRERPDIVLLEARAVASLPMLAAILASVPETKVIAYGVSDDGDDAVTFAEAGVAGYVSNDARIEELVEIIGRVVAGEFPCSPRVAARMAKRVARLAAGQALPAAQVVLTAREREVLRHIDEGLSNKEIAKRLGIELSTVKNHVHNILEKTRASRRSQAAARLRPGLTLAGRGGDLDPRIQTSTGLPV